MNERGSPVRVAILAFPEATASVVYGLYDLFRSAGRDWGMIVEGRPGAEAMQPLVVSAHAGPFEAANGVRITPDAGLDDQPAPDIVCVPELFVAPGEPIEGRFPAEIAWLKRCHAAGATLAATCSGALMLAEAGLLDGHDATTHWAFCDTLASRYPKVRVHTQRALVVSGEGQRLVMAGGGTSWLDLALYLIARTTGAGDGDGAALRPGRAPCCGWRKPNTCWRRGTRRWRRSPARWATRTPASSAACSGARCS